MVLGLVGQCFYFWKTNENFRVKCHDVYNVFSNVFTHKYCKIAIIVYSEKWIYKIVVVSDISAYLKFSYEDKKGETLKFSKCTNTGTLPFMVLHYIVLPRYGTFYKLKVCGNPEIAGFFVLFFLVITVF